MRTPLAWQNLLHEPARTIVAVAGVGFAVLLIFVQLGFFLAVRNTATLIYDALDFDFALVSSEYLDILRPGSFPRERLVVAHGWAGVREVRPLSVGIHGWRNPEDASRVRRNLLVLGVDPEDPPFRHPELTAGHVAVLGRPNAVLMDRKSRPEFGVAIVPDQTETDLALTKVRVMGRYSLGSGFGADGMVITSQRTFASVFGPTAGRSVSLGLIRLADGASPVEVNDLAVRVRPTLPPDVKLFTRSELESLERTTWVWKRSLGKIFVMGLALAFVVGVVFVYQVIASDIGNRLAEFATLKAMGYSDRYLGGVVLRQAVLLAVFGFAPGLFVAGMLYSLMRQVAGLPVDLSWPIATGVLAMAIVMCCLSALMAVRKVRAADAADLF
jgi:putative ABC transport system permease protein